MNRCINCEKRFLCTENQDEICEDFKREPYMMLIEFDGEYKKLERIDE